MVWLTRMDPPKFYKKNYWVSEAFDVPSVDCLLCDWLHSLCCGWLL